MINIGVIGYGYWGPNIVRNFMVNSETAVVTVCDSDRERLDRVQSLYPRVCVTRDAQELIANPSIDAVVIATPVDSHFNLAMATLKADKHVLVEKPMTSTSDQAHQLIEEAARKKLVLMVDHTFVYTSAVRKMREITRQDTFGDLQYYDSARVNLGIFRHDVNVLWDLAVHDLSIMCHLIDNQPIAVSATGSSHIAGEPENIAFLTVYYENNLIAHVNVNWLSPVKIRRTLVCGSRKMIVYDDLETSEKLKIYDKGITIAEDPDDIRKLMIGYRTGDLWSPNLENAEALAVEVDHFVACIEGKETPLTGGDKGLMVVRILEAADASMRDNGRPIELGQ